MTLNDLTNDKQQRELNHDEPRVKRPKKDEQLSDRELNELMGVSRDRYHKVNRRVRRK